MSSLVKWSVAVVASAGLGVVPAVAAMASPSSPGTSGTAAPNAQCGTAAGSGGFNAHNLIYGPNSSAFGTAGGAGGGQAGINNSSVCGAR